MTKKLILNADDFGLRHSINSSIIYLLKNNFITSASIMVKRNIEALKEAVCRAQEFIKTASFGLHLDLDEFFFFDEIGRYGNNENDIIDNYKKIITTNKDDLISDITLQIDTLKSMGLPISHIDGHHFIHQFTEILELLLPIMKQKNIMTMRFNPSFYLSSQHYHSALNLLNRFNIKRPDSFYDLSDIMYNNKNIEHEETNTIEIMIHSEIEDPDASSWTVQQHNYLKNNKDIFHNFHLTNFTDFL